MVHYDCIVIGAGPGGYTAAEKAASLGKKAALVEKRELGGTCLNRGCIPTKTLLHAAEALEAIKEGKLSGIEADIRSIDYECLQNRKNDVIDQLRKGIEARMKKAKVDVIYGTAKIVSGHEVRVGDTVFEAEQILIASGSVPAVPKIPGLEHIDWVSSDELLDLKEPIQRLTILGGGVIGCEFASLYAALGTEVTIIEAQDRLLPGLDREIGISLAQLFKKRGIQVLTSASLKKVSEAGVLEVEGNKGIIQLESEKLLIAVGRRAFSEGLFEEGFSVEMEKGRILVNEQFQTSCKSIWAIGDVIGQVQLAHAASAQGINAVMAMANRSAVYSLEQIPSCIYTNPEIATVGMTLQEAKEKGLDVISVKVTMGANGKSLLSNQERGFIKAIVDQKQKTLVGAVMMCARATDMISLFTQTINLKLKINDLACVIYPHPTFSEAIGELIETIETKLK